MTMQCEVHERINAGAAALNRDLFSRHDVFVASLFGWRHCGKTSLLEATLRSADDLRIGVVIGNVLADQEAQRLRKLAQQVIAIEAVDLNASLLHEAMARIDLSELDVLLIERGGASVVVNHGGLDLGQAANVDTFSVSDGDNAVRYPERIKHADLMLLTKTDLIPQGEFNFGRFSRIVQRLNPDAPLFAMSLLTGQGVDQWIAWLRAKREAVIH